MEEEVQNRNPVSLRQLIRERGVKPGATEAYPIVKTKKSDN